MSAQFWSRRDLLKAVPGVALAAHARPALAQSVKWSAGTEAPRFKAPANATDCHHHIYDAKYPDWVPDERTRHRVLVDNPATLYDFPKGS